MNRNLLNPLHKRPSWPARARARLLAVLDSAATVRLLLAVAVVLLAVMLALTFAAGRGVGCP